MTSPVRWFKSERTFVFDAFGAYVIGLTGRERPSVQHFLIGKWRSRKLCKTCGCFKYRHHPECPDA